MCTGVIPACTTIRTVLDDGMTTAREVRLCGEIGLIVRTSLRGTTIGPPLASEYAVDPVGVVTMIPSAEYVTRYSSSTYVSSSMTLGDEPRSMTISLRETNVSPAPFMTVERHIRSST